MSMFPCKSSRARAVWVKDVPETYKEDWDVQGLVEPPVHNGEVVQGVPFWAAQQLHRLKKIPRQLRGATKPLVITTSKIGEPYYTPQLDFDLRPVRPIPLTYNNLLDPHLKHYFNNPVKKKVLVKQGLVTQDGDVVCHSMKEFNSYRDMLYWNYNEMLSHLRKDVGRYMPKILAKRRAIAEITSEQRRYSVLQRGNKELQKKYGVLKETRYSNSKVTGLSKSQKQSQNVDWKIKDKSSIGALKKPAGPNKKKRLGSKQNGKSESSQQLADRQNAAATTIQAAYKGYITRKKLAQDYKAALKKHKKHRYGDSLSHKKIWDRKKQDTISTCHTHSCTERLACQFEITDIPSMMHFLKDPVAQQAYRRRFLLRLMHTPNMDISGMMAAPLLKEEVKQHSSKFRWV